MPNSKALSPDSTAERTALWRALHLQADAPPHVFEDDIGLRLLAPPDSWRQRPDMDPVFTGPSARPWSRGRVSWKTWCWNRPPRASRST